MRHYLFRYCFCDLQLLSDNFSEKVEFVRISNTDIIEPAWLQGLSFYRNEDFRIHLWRTELRAADIIFTLCTVDNDLEDPANLLAFQLLRDALLDPHQLINPLLFDLLWNIIFIMCRTVCSLFFRIGKSPHPFEADLSDECF